jgi:hypothetical protein
MSSVEIAMDFLWEFLSPVLSDTVKEKIKPKKSEEKAKEKAFKLYQVLSEIDRISETYFGALKDSVEAIRINPDGEKDYEALSKSVLELSQALPALVKALEDINPQLGIYKLELDLALKLYLRSRGDVLRQLGEYIPYIHRVPSDELEKILATSMKNQILIAKAIKEMREFLIAEFSFKESF